MAKQIPAIKVKATFGIPIAKLNETAAMAAFRKIDEVRELLADAGCVLVDLTGNLGNVRVEDEELEGVGKTDATETFVEPPAPIDGPLGPRPSVLEQQATQEAEMAFVRGDGASEEPDPEVPDFLRRDNHAAA